MIWTQELASLLRVIPWPANAVRIPRLQAHRGYWISGIQENTIAAFQEARLKGALMSECDVQLSRDEVPIVFHDTDLMRLFGRPEKVMNLSANELKEFKIPTLEEVLRDPSLTPGFNIEIKSLSVTGTPLERKVAEVILRTHSENRVLFSSFNPFSLFLLEKYLPQVPRCFLWSKASSESRVIKPEWALGITGIHGLNICYEDVSTDQIKSLKNKNVTVSLWTVNATDKINWFLNNGADSIITDHLE